VTGDSITSSTNNAKLTFQMVPGLELTANFVDIEPPMVTITTKSGTGSNSVVAITGTASDNVGVASVWCQVGNNGWSLAATSDAYTNWTATVILSMGTNIIQVYAEDAAGNRSKTNSVTLVNDSAGFAPESLAGTTVQLNETNAAGGAMLSFDEGSFSQVGSGGPATGVGLYNYNLSDANTGQLATTFTAPPLLVSNTLSFEFVILSYDVVTLSFTDDTSGTFADTNGDSGTFTLSIASNTAPEALSGLTLRGADTNSVYQFTNVYSEGTFTTTDTSGDSSGTYTYSQYSPTAGLLQEIFTNGSDSGTTNNVLLIFSMDSDTYYVESDTAGGTNTDAGTFSFSGGTPTAGYTAPETLAGLTGTVSGSSVPHMFSFDASSYGDFSAGTSHANKEVSDVGTYTYTRTGPTTALVQTIDFAPPEEAGTNNAVLLHFTSSHNATITTGSGHETITFSESANTAPLSLAGRKFTGLTGVISFGSGTFTGSGAIDEAGGTYTYTPYGPQVAMAILNFTTGNTPATAPGSTWYVEMWFSSATSGSDDNNDFTVDGVLNSLTSGSFTLH
jgi:hypothetical protein